SRSKRRRRRSRSACRRTKRRTGCSRRSWHRCASRSGRQTGFCASLSISDCGTTRRPRTSHGRRNRFRVPRFQVPGSMVPSFRVRSKVRSAVQTGNQEPGTRNLANLVEQFRFLEDARRDSFITLPDGQELKVTNLHKIFWPKLKLTKGDLFRYYAQVAPYILPVVADRPMVMKRFPNGVDAEPFYQHRVLDVPKNVRVETIEHSDGAKPQLIGGDLVTLLYMTQIAAISQDPWFSRVQSIDEADYAAIDLDPAPGVTFNEILEVARWVHDEL